MRAVDVLGYDVSREGLVVDAAQTFEACLSVRHVPFVVACANPHSLVEAGSDEAFSRSLRSADLLIPDGVGIVIASRMLGAPVRERVAGMEFFLETSRLAQRQGGKRYFFLGSSDTVLEAIRARLKVEYPDIEVVGVYSPPFKKEFSDSDNEKMLEAINSAAPDVLWVGMTAPKQEKWIDQHKEQLQVKMAASIGAVFDFYAGNKKRAPDWVRSLGLEWLPRLLREPRRLAKRNFVSSPLFIARVLFQAARERRVVGRP
jgi:N-acetylglucosaminyldiphosphoundecaprenol N-acetyl-beta-D-mannosaminyltransferase